ncbi:hypothetical protein CBF90_09330 [Microbacterium sp. AISO3]|uniref:hypothetical protein n=1 Tax=Microbacterium sp. AISO3 TaxID=2002831 RepID=UPI000B4DE372|nr:hypothetical protein [Microbacterium sp. AISO3]OWP21881.1 hypothetical protein CBF90_09330 [Microbacterium sp. AISO3]
MTSPRHQRALRAGAAATLATFVALLSHVAAGGEPPSGLGAALPWALSLVVSLVVVGRRLSAVRLGAAVTAAQVLFHVMFALGVVPLAGSAGVSTAGASQTTPMSLHAGHMSLPASLSAPGALAAVAPDAAMIGAHVLAAVATTLLLHRGERLLSALLGLARRIAVRLRSAARDAVPPAPNPLRVRAIVSSVRMPRRCALVAAPARRGPPVLLAL